MSSIFFNILYNIRKHRHCGLNPQSPTPMRALVYFRIFTQMLRGCYLEFTFVRHNVLIYQKRCIGLNQTRKKGDDAFGRIS